MRLATNRRVMRPNSKESVMLEQDLPQWLLHTDIILGWDDPDEEEEEEPDPDEEEGEEEEEDEDEEEEEEDKGKSKSKAKKSAATRQLEEAEESLTKVKATLRKERNLRKDAQRRLKEAGISTSTDSGGSGGGKGNKQDDQAQREAEDDRRKSAEREKRLATRVAAQAVDTVIIKLAPSFGFMDVDDAVRLLNRKDVDVDQDDDDPAIIEVDEDDVKRALRALAKSKPHLLKPKEDKGKGDEGGGGGDGKTKTGSKFNSKKDKNSTNLEELKKRFPALNR